MFDNAFVLITVEDGKLVISTAFDDKKEDFLKIFRCCSSLQVLSLLFSAAENHLALIDKKDDFDALKIKMSKALLEDMNLLKETVPYFSKDIEENEEDEVPVIDPELVFSPGALNG